MCSISLIREINLPRSLIANSVLKFKRIQAKKGKKNFVHSELCTSIRISTTKTNSCMIYEGTMWCNLWCFEQNFIVPILELFLTETKLFMTLLTFKT